MRAAPVSSLPLWTVLRASQLWTASESLVSCPVLFTAPKNHREKANIQSNIYQGNESRQVAFFLVSEDNYFSALPPLLLLSHLKSRSCFLFPLSWTAVISVSLLG